jgi:transposase
VEVDADYATCHRCGQVSKPLHSNQGYWVRDLPQSNRKVWLIVNRRRFKCGNCGKHFSEDLNFVGRRKKYTNRYALRITEQVIHSDVHNIAQSNQLTHEEVWSMVNHVVEQRGERVHPNFAKIPERDRQLVANLKFDNDNQPEEALQLHSLQKFK